MNISADKVGVTIDGRSIINNISLTAKPQQFVGVIGPNGSGKSTLLKCIYRVLKPTNGAVFLNQASLSSLSVKQSAQRLAVVSQHNFYNFDFKIEEVVLMGRNPHKRRLETDTASDFQIVDDCLKKVGMHHFKGRNFNTLSGGEQQRVILARALTQQTPCLILDEPTNHLDIKYQLQLLDIVKSLDITVLAAIHDLNIAAMYCDYIYAMKDGQMLLSGTPAEIITSQNIKDLYEVDSNVWTDQSGMLHITYYPQHLQKL